LSNLIVNVDDLRLRARRRLPDVVFQYLDGGAEAEVTLRENCRAFQAVTFRPRNAVSVPSCDLSVTVVGSRLSMPFLLAPCGFTRLFHPGGEVAAARAAGLAGVGYTLSTISGYSLEEVRSSSSGPVWYQLYLLGGREAAEATIERARVADYSALVVTIDTGAPGMRERDVRNGAAQLLGGSWQSRIRFLPQLLLRPSWLVSFQFRSGPLELPNVVLPGRGPMPLAEVPAELIRSAVTWEDLKWIRALWTGPIVVKGVLTADDARRAADEGAAAVVVSNHGGRQLDGVQASLRALPEIVRALSGRMDVLMDGGIRRGGDIVKALCLGARAVLVGRAYAYGLGADGERGVTRAIGILRADLDRTLKLLGCPSVVGLDSSYVDVPPAWSRGRDISLPD
jgi:isopentenyl diphosphate isomerase/L-lactate dehydrogenase-like FMN-dependent dehydrogenase